MEGILVPSIGMPRGEDSTGIVTHSNVRAIGCFPEPHLVTCALLRLCVILELRASVYGRRD